MDRWQLHYGDAVAFICIGCAGPALAVQFSQRLRLRHCTVAVAVDQPRWGQLGCNGFIILDAGQNVVCAASSAFLEVRNLAFRHVETVLDAVIAGRAPPRMCPGMRVMLTGLSKATMNGEMALCLEPGDGPQSRCTVQLSRSGRTASVQERNLNLLLESDDEHEEHGEPSVVSSCESGDCALPPEVKKQKQQDSRTAATCSAEGGCALPSRDETSACDEIVTPLSAIDSVSVDVLDEEHEQCAAALDDFAKHRTCATLRSVLDAYRMHFAHEEKMLDEHMYPNEVSGASGGGFSAAKGQRKSHYADHARMITAIIAQLGRMTEGKGQATADGQFVNTVLRDFETHAGTYDATYVGEIAKAADP